MVDSSFLYSEHVTFSEITCPLTPMPAQSGQRIGSPGMDGPPSSHRSPTKLRRVRPPRVPAGRRPGIPHSRLLPQVSQCCSRPVQVWNHMAPPNGPMTTSTIRLQMDLICQLTGRALCLSQSFAHHQQPPDHCGQRLTGWTPVASDSQAIGHSGVALRSAPLT